VVSQVRMNATMVQSVVTYDTIIEFANPDLKLFPGMTAYVTIPVASVQDVVKVPNTALRYKPPLPADQIVAIYKQYGIEAGGRNAADAAGAATAVQGASGGALAPRGPKADTAVVWRMHPDNSLEPIKVSLGITDHAYTEVAGVLKGALQPGDDLVIRSVTPKTQGPGALRR
jgi:HlyD family secretion protein